MGYLVVLTFWKRLFSLTALFIALTFFIASNSNAQEAKSKLLEDLESLASTDFQGDEFATGRASLSSRGAGFSHRIFLNPIAGLPSSMTLTTKDRSIERVRVLLEYDNRLLVLELSYFKSSAAFRGNFPTPRQSLSYRFQFLTRSGESFVSPLLTANSLCTLKRRSVSFGRQSQKKKDKDALLRSARELEKNNQLLYYSASQISQLIEGSE